MSYSTLSPRWPRAFFCMSILGGKGVGGQSWQSASQQHVLNLPGTCDTRLWAMQFALSGDHELLLSTPFIWLLVCSHWFPTPDLMHFKWKILEKHQWKNDLSYLICIYCIYTIYSVYKKNIYIYIEHIYREYIHIHVCVYIYFLPHNLVNNVKLPHIQLCTLTHESQHGVIVTVDFLQYSQFLFNFWTCYKT